MTKLLLILMILLLSISFFHPGEEGTDTSPSPDGDIRMGADATNSGTDISDQELQAQEEKRLRGNEGNDIKKEDLHEENQLNMNVK